MEGRTLGRTELTVTPIGLGIMQFAGGAGMFRYMFPPIDQERMTAIVRAALDGGIDWFDTAEMYGGGRSEQGLAAALQALDVAPGGVGVATKWNPLLRSAGNIPRTIERRRSALAPYPIDLYQVHQPWSFSPPEAEMDAMADLVESGQIRAVGVSNFDERRMRRAHAELAKRGLALATNQVHYSLLHREIETNGVLDAAKELGVSIIAYSPLDSGLLTGKFHRDASLLEATPLGRRMNLRRRLERSRPVIELLEAIAADRAVTPSQVALAWLVRRHGDTVVAIPGASKPEHAADVAAALHVTLEPDELERLDAVSSSPR
ncbi:MAG: aldo/keto reductase [Deinococcales bacterium]